MKQMKFVFIIFAATVPFLAFAMDDYHYSRIYRSNEEFAYKLTTVVHQNGQFDTEEVGESHHKFLNVTSPFGEIVPYEEVVWRSLSKKGQGGTVDLSSEAKKVHPYQISLHPKGSLSIPKLDVPAMVGMITDLNTYYVAISEAIGIQKISKKDDVFENPNELTGNWADGISTIVGQDCTKATLSLVALDADIAIVKSEFLAPNSKCISMQKPWMVNPIVAGVPNNIQQVRKTGDTYEVMWGHEQFIITADIDRTSGVIRQATMDNTLTLKMKIGCDSNLENCQSEFPFVIQRNEQLQMK